MYGSWNYHFLKGVGIINHQIRNCANKYIRDRLQSLRSSKICKHFPVRSDYKMSSNRKRNYTDIE